jgi:hypothetical protein
MWGVSPLGLALMLAIVCPSLAAAQHTRQSADGRGRTKDEKFTPIPFSQKDFTPLREDFFEQWRERKQVSARNSISFTEWRERIQQNGRRRQQHVQVVKADFERELGAKRALLARDGPLLEFNVTSNAWGYVNNG